MNSAIDQEKNIEIMERMLYEFNQKIYELEEIIKARKKDSTNKYDQIIEVINGEIKSKMEKLLREKEVFKKSGDSVVKDISHSIDRTAQDLNKAIKIALHRLNGKANG